MGCLKGLGVAEWASPVFFFTSGGRDWNRSSAECLVTNLGCNGTRNHVGECHNNDKCPYTISRDADAGEAHPEDRRPLALNAPSVFVSFGALSLVGDFWDSPHT